MLISAMYPRESILTVVNALDNAIDFGVIGEEDYDVVRDFMTSLSTLSKVGPVVLCKKTDHDRMSDSEDLLYSLKGAGVDNWSGYDDALEDYWNNKEEG